MLSLREGEVAGRSGWEHVAGNGNRSARGLVQPQRVIGPVHPERGVDDRQENLQLESRGHARSPVGGLNDLQIAIERRVLRMSSGAVQGDIESRTTENRAVDYRKLPIVNPQLRAPKDGIDSQIDKGNDRNRSRDGEAVFQIGDQTCIATGEDDPLDRHRNGVCCLAEDCWDL